MRQRQCDLRPWDIATAESRQQLTLFLFSWPSKNKSESSGTIVQQTHKHIHSTCWTRYRLAHSDLASRRATPARRYRRSAHLCSQVQKMSRKKRSSSFDDNNNALVARRSRHPTSRVWQANKFFIISLLLMPSFAEEAGRGLVVFGLLGRDTERPVSQREL